MYILVSASKDRNDRPISISVSPLCDTYHEFSERLLWLMFFEWTERDADEDEEAHISYLKHLVKHGKPINYSVSRTYNYNTDSEGNLISFSTQCAGEDEFAGESHSIIEVKQ